MKSSCSFLFIMIIATFLCYETIAQPDFTAICNTDNGNYTTNSTYQHNLNKLLSTLISNTEITYGFYNFTDGVDNNKVYAIGLCRGDVNPQNCRQCLNNSRLLLTQQCPHKKEAIGWIDHCMLRYSHRSIFGLTETWPAFSMFSPYKATDVDEYNKVLEKLLYDLKNQAASGNSMKKYRFYELTGQPPQPPPPPPPSSPSTNYTSAQGKTHTSRTVAIIGIPIAIVVFILCFICIYLRLRVNLNLLSRPRF